MGYTVLDIMYQAWCDLNKEWQIFEVTETWGVRYVSNKY